MVLTMTLVGTCVSGVTPVVRDARTETWDQRRLVQLTFHTRVQIWACLRELVFLVMVPPQSTKVL